MMEDNIDKQLISAVATCIAKATFYICCAVVACMWVSSCELNDEIIISCKQSCSGYGAHMESVTNRECVCSKETESIEMIPNDIWVLPK